MKDNEEFNYFYAAPTLEERKEVEAIKRKYMAERLEKTNIEKLKLLDKKVKRLPNIIFYIVLTVGILVLGLGLTFCLEWNNVWLGAIIGIFGGVISLVSFKVKKILANYYKKKYSKEIIALSDTILSESK